MKRWISLLGGLIIGIILSYFTLDYKGWTLEYIDENGKTIKAINELDFDLITNSVLIVIGISILIYGIWTLIEKKTKDL
ncbi:hypothetical protein [Neobacillus sp. PS3-40]|uniref:hypothetical protein n=1 Tax=Neobacillus sp. PS3-40 TaxID=3070679 RepID=UPI0027DFE812|nr:hypothetical protein [Neobacillus sp. PS3-40]WML44308.1 hypothetical protein RCG20_21500 [Neobacillus sp. PS3-40]